jgi:hypothetical protein
MLHKKITIEEIRKSIENQLEEIIEMHKKIRAGTYKPESKVDVIGEKNVT